MQKYEIIQWTFSILSLLWVFCFGAVVGSFLNVLAYRMPRGLNVVSPPSACPACGTRLTWRENVPILGWLRLGGKCRFCQSKISPEYPIVEFVTGALFAIPYAMWFMDPSILGNTLSIAPEWASNPLWGAVWPYFLALLALLGTLTAITLIDAKTFTIPLSLPVFATIVGLIAHLGMGAWHQMAGVRMHTAPEFGWVIPLPTGPFVGLTVGALLGLVISNALLWAGAIRHSFHDYEEWEAGALKEMEALKDAGGDAEDSGEHISITSLLARTLALTGPCIALMFIGFSVGIRTGHVQQGIGIGAGVGLLIGMFLRRAIATPTGDDEPIWLHYPNTTREILRELVFLIPAILLGIAGFALTTATGPLGASAASPPLWLHATLGSVFGYLVGGGAIWALRIFGSLAFGREAMGLGDVHLLACVGAVVGWADPMIAFVLAPFIAIAWFLLSTVFSSVFNRKGTAIPFGPHLAAASVLVLFAKPIFESALGMILGKTINLP
ncbi:MAG: A24 family peptidase [Phycisphaerales bacterium]